LRVVIDTNVFVSSSKGGVPKQIIDLVDKGSIVLCISPEIVNEYIRVYKRLKLDNRYLDKLLLFCEGADSIDIDSSQPGIVIVKEDPDDDKFIHCAHALKADYLITGDKALIIIKKYGTTQIVTPRQFLDIYNENFK
jgi:putative PIN family toxin of toxin-antitoxin system